jgi:preprotein translocase subunit SecG
MTIIFYLSLFLFLTLCAVLCLVVLVQESKSLGLGASFGGDAGVDDEENFSFITQKEANEYFKTFKENYNDLY